MGDRDQHFEAFLLPSQGMKKAKFVTGHLYWATLYAVYKTVKCPLVAQWLEHWCANPAVQVRSWRSRSSQLS